MQTKKLRASAVAWLLLMPLFIGLFFIGGTNAGVTPTLDETSWMKGTIDGTSDVSNVISETIDLDGYLHVAYYDTTDRDLMYATNSNGVWRFEAVDSSGDVGKYNSIAVDSAGKVHISYYDASENDLKYASGNFDSWSMSVVDSTGVVGEYNSIICESGKVHITYLDYSNDALKHAVKSGGSWSHSVAVEDVGFGNTLMSVGSDLHVAYLSQGGKLNYATSNGTDWTTESIDASSSFGKEVDIDMLNGQPCVAYYDTISHELNLAIRGVSGIWSRQVVDTTSNVGSWLSLDVDSIGMVHISYFDMLNQDLVYAVYDETWDFFVLDTSGGMCSAMVSDYNDKQHIVYIDLVEASTELSYITNSGANWMMETVDEDGTVGEHSSIAVGTDGTIHIAYYDGSNGTLNYATNNGGWSVQIVDNSTSMVGLSPSLVLDANGIAHISYHDMTGARILKYATNSGGNWNIRTLDGSGDVGSFSSIALDSHGKVHIAYLNSEAHTLKYTSNSDGDWIINLIDTSGTVEGKMSLAIDSLNKVHVVYYRGGELIHANQIATGWATESLESSDQLGGGISMFIDSHDNVYVTYHNEVLTLLKSINNVGGEWNPAEIIESEGSVGVASAIMVDDNGDEHIAYVDLAGQGILKYAERRSGIWMFQKVDLQSCGNSISMDMDLQGRVHISYFDTIENDLRYASSVIVPSAPTNLTVVVGNGFLTLEWQAPQNDGGSNITEYRLFRADPDTGEFIMFANTGPTTTSFSYLGLENGVTVLYRVRAVNSEGSSIYSNEVAGTPCTLPGAPDVDASGKDKGVTLDWDEPDNGGADIEQYNIYRKNETGMWLLIGTVDGSVTKFTDNGLENGVEYSYYVTAINPAGAGLPSETASATANPTMDMMLIIIVVIVVLAAVGVAAFFLLRKGRR